MDISYFTHLGGLVLDFFLPRRCAVCNRVLDTEEKHLCEHCWSDIPHTYHWIMRNNPMADRFNEMMQKRLEAEWDEDSDCKEEIERYAYACALFFYRAESDYRNITRCIKYQGSLDLGKTFGRILGDRLKSSRLFSDVDAVIPVPLHWTREWERGYNQAEVIASGVAESLGVPLRCDFLKRHRRTKTQTRLEIEEKSANVKDAFVVEERFLREYQKHWDNSRKSSDASQKPGDTFPAFTHLLLIDDVFTTGSTLFACFTALRAFFPPSVRISVATLGFVGDV